SRQKINEIIIRNAKDLIIGKAERNKTEKPNTTDTALILIPLPVVLSATRTESTYVPPDNNSFLIRQKI
ncbi:hypothetical protein RZS08_22505, partial [Arthrospira platensis SPKY1]|nr:hypothetical protein [Arthrospira platensis SPKY1]